MHNLFCLIHANKAYFGLKDFQQFAVIKHMVKNTGLHIELVGSPTIRNNEGLALSSRNNNLSAEQKDQALIINKTLRFVLRQTLLSARPSNTATARHQVV